MNYCKKASFKTGITGTLAVASLGMVLFAEASAACGNPEARKSAAVHPLLWQGTGQSSPVPLLPVADREDSVDRIVGLWKVTFETDNGTVVDDGFAQWHADGTEIHNSSRPAASGNFCLGIWKKTGRIHYTLNHVLLSSTLTSDPVTDALSDRVQLREEIDLDHGGDAYSGTVTVDDYDLSGKLLAHLQWTVHATRVTVNTDLKELF